MNLHCIEKTNREDGSMVATLIVVATPHDQATVSGNIVISTNNADLVQPGYDYDLNLNKLG